MTHNYDRLIIEHSSTVSQYESRVDSLNEAESYSYWEARHFLDFHALETPNGLVDEGGRSALIKQYGLSKKKIR